MAVNEYSISCQKDCLSLQYLKRSGLYPLVAELVEAGEGDTMPWIRDRLPRPSDECIFLSICVSNDLSIHPPINPSKNESIHPPLIYLPTHPFIHSLLYPSLIIHSSTYSIYIQSRIYPPTHSSIHLSIDPPIIYILPPFTHLAAHPHVNPPTHPFILLAIHISVHPSLGPLQHTWPPPDWALC